MILVSGMDKIFGSVEGLNQYSLFSLLDERYTCYRSEFDSGDVVSKCVVIKFYEFYITSTIIFG